MRIDEDVIRDLKHQAQEEGLSLTKLVNRVLRQALRAERQEGKPRPAYREKVFSLGQPKVDLTKAIALAASLEDSEIRDKLARRK